jgi:hypothetical protein
MDTQTMPPTERAHAGSEIVQDPITPLKPALASIKASCNYMGGVSRAKFYADLLPLLETVKLGGRNFVVIASMDRLIEAKRICGVLHSEGSRRDRGGVSPADVAPATPVQHLQLPLRPIRLAGAADCADGAQRDEDARSSDD